MLNNVLTRVGEWNAARYQRVYHHPLQVRLLIEEWTEYLEAKEEVDQLDALCDMTYVALGGIWKMNKVTTEERALSSILAAEAEQGRELDLAMQRFVATQAPALDHWFVIRCVFREARRVLRLNSDQLLRAMHVVCDANDSKSVKKTDPTKKANDGDKGANFISPEPRLQEILDERHC